MDNVNNTRNVGANADGSPDKRGGADGQAAQLSGKISPFLIMLHISVSFLGSVVRSPLEKLQKKRYLFF